VPFAREELVRVKKELVLAFTSTRKGGRRLTISRMIRLGNLKNQQVSGRTTEGPQLCTSSFLFSYIAGL